MKFFSIDIETTGLNIERDQILHIAAVFEDTKKFKPIEELPTFERVICRPRIEGDPFALAMNAELICAISNQGGGGEVFHNDRSIPSTTLAGRVWWHDFTYFVDKCIPQGAAAARSKVVVAGKNAAGFDLPFILREVGPLAQRFFHYRVIDPGNMALGRHPEWWDELDAPPGMAEIRQRLDMPEQEHAHDALYDARSVIEILRRLW